jgi:hypothetical protein
VLSNSDARLTIKAVTKGWAIPDDKRPEVIKQLLEIAENGSERNRVMAARALMAVPILEMDGMKLDLAERRFEFDQDKAVADRLAKNGLDNLPDSALPK